MNGKWEGRDVYTTLAGCPVIMLDEPRGGVVKFMYIHPTNNYGYGQFTQGYYPVADLKPAPDYGKGEEE